MSTRLKRRAVTESVSAENVTPAEIHRRLQAVYGEDTVNITTVNRLAIKFREYVSGRANIVDQPRSGSQFVAKILYFSSYFRLFNLLAPELFF